MAAERDLSLAALTVLELAPPEAIAVAARCGFSHIGLRPIAATPDEFHFALLSDKALRAATIAALDDHGIGVLDIEILRLTPDVIVADFEAVLAFGQQVGARFAVVAGNDHDLARTADNFAELCALAAPFGIRPHLEFMPWTDVPNLATAISVAGSADASILVDAFHLNRSGGRAHDLPLHDRRFGYAQFCDIAGPIPAAMAEILREAREDRLFPGEGECDLVALLRRLPHSVPISVEVPTRRARITPEERAKRAYQTTRRVLDSAEQKG